MSAVICTQTTCPHVLSQAKRTLKAQKLQEELASGKLVDQAVSDNVPFMHSALQSEKCHLKNVKHLEIYDRQIAFK